jgi:hypothetical protein
MRMPWRYPIRVISQAKYKAIVIISNGLYITLEMISCSTSIQPMRIGYGVYAKLRKLVRV